MSKSAILEASFVKDCLPEPPTPTSNAWPPGYFKILPILKRCSIAKLNKTNGIYLSVMLLYWLNASSAHFYSLGLSRISSYGLSGIPNGV